MFEKARYGQNDTVGSVRCHVPFNSNCEIDVQHSLNAACGGQVQCSLAVNTAFFDDPCGYDEFLYVDYRCLPGSDSRVSVCRYSMQLACWHVRVSSDDVLHCNYNTLCLSFGQAAAK